MEVHLVIHLDGSSIKAIDQKLTTLVRKVESMSDNLQSKIDALTSEVEENATVVQSAVVLIGGISKQIADAVEKAKSEGVPAESLASLDALTAKLDSDNKALAEAVAANTPSSEEDPAPAA